MLLLLLYLLPLLPVSFGQLKALHRPHFKPPLISLNAPSPSPASQGIEDIYNLSYLYYVF